MTRRASIVLIGLAAGLTLTGCGVDVREHGPAGTTEVDVRTPIGGISVRTDVDAPAAGLPVYPGARRLQDIDDPGGANVDIGLPFVHMKIVAAKFEHEDRPDEIVEFYRNAMRTYGDVVECRGEIDFRTRMGRTRPVCDEKRSARDVQLVVGTEQRHRMVLVKPRRDGSEFAVVYIRTDAES